MSEHLSESPEEARRRRDEEDAEKFQRSRGLLPVPEVKKLDTSKYLKKNSPPRDSMVPPPIMLDAKEADPVFPSEPD